MEIYRSLPTLFRTSSVRGFLSVLLTRTRVLNLAEREGFEPGGAVNRFSTLLKTLELASPLIPQKPRIRHQICHQHAA